MLSRFVAHGLLSNFDSFLNTIFQLSDCYEITTDIDILFFLDFSGSLINALYRYSSTVIFKIQIHFSMCCNITGLIYVFGSNDV